VNEAQAERLGDILWQNRVNVYCEIEGIPPLFPEVAEAMADQAVLEIGQAAWGYRSLALEAYDEAQKLMSKVVPPSGSCPRCGSEWTFTGNEWLWKERSGAAHLLKEYRALDGQGQPPPLTRCPCCRWSLTEKPRARVEEGRE